MKAKKLWLFAFGRTAPRGRCVGLSFLIVRAALIVGLFCVVGCGDGKAEHELQELRAEIAQMKSEIREMRLSVERRQVTDVTHRRAQMQRVGGVESVMTNGVSRKQHALKNMRAEKEYRRKMMSDPEMRKKIEAERKARMEERRRQHEERRREMEARRQSRPAPTAVVPDSAAK